MWKFTDLVRFKTGQIIFRRRNNVLPKILNVKFSQTERGATFEKTQSKDNNEEHAVNSLWSGFVE